MSELTNIFMPGARHWDEVKQAEKSLFLDAQQGGSGPGKLDLDSGFLVLNDRTGTATETLTTIGNPYRELKEIIIDDENSSASDTLSHFSAPQNLTDQVD